MLKYPSPDGPLSSCHHASSHLIALIGDAVRSVHPLAGQGLNLGIRDSVLLSEVVEQWVKAGSSPGDPSCLQEYDTATLVENGPMAASIDAAKLLFSPVQPTIAALRGLGMDAVSGVPLLSKAVAGFAS